MTEIVAAHLERAKELVQQLDDEQLVYWCTESGLPIGSIDPARERAIQVVAAALAACAREEAKWWAKNGTHGYITDEAAERLAILERAVGEKA